MNRVYETKTYDLNAEAGVISSIINDPDLLPKVHNSIREFFFYRKRNGMIWRAIITLYKEDKPIDLISVLYWLKLNETFPQDEMTCYLNEIVDMVISPSLDSLKHFIEIIADQYQVRQKEKMSLTIMQETKKHTSFSKIKKILNDYEVLSIDTNEYKPVFPETIGKIINIANKEDEDAIDKGITRQRGLSIGFPSLDRYTRMRPKNTYCIAARPNMGKTSLMLIIALNLIKRGYRVGIVSLEMSKEQLMEKLISYTQEISNTNFLALHEAQQIERRKRLLQYLGNNVHNLIIDDYSTEMSEIRNSIYDMHRRDKLDLIIVDYLQLTHIEGWRENRNQEVTTISRMFKSDIATKLQIPVLALSQLSRAPEMRKNRRPILSDLRESGSLEQDFTIVMFIYRDEEYGIFLDSKGRSTKGIAEIQIAKNRFGPKGIKRLGFKNEYALFFDLEKGHEGTI